jgi:NTE family protein
MRAVEHSSPASSDAPMTAFVLSGGARLGAMQAGMLRALYEHGIVPDLLVATSAGALNAAFIASRPQTLATAEELSRVWRGLQREDIFPIHACQVIGGLANLRDHLVPDSGLRALAGRHLQFELLEHADIPVHLVALDLHRGADVLLCRGPALDAVLASAAIPGVLLPVRRGDQLLVDGGVVNNTPISHAVELGATRIYVLPTDDPVARAMPAAPHGALDAAVHAFTLLVNARLYADLERYASEVELIVLPAANPHHVQPSDFGHASRLIGAAHTAARLALDAASAVEPLAA